MMSRWLKRRLNRRKISLVCCLLIFIIGLFWHATDSAVALDVGENVQKSLDTAWETWNDLLDKLTSMEKFYPVPNVDCDSEPQSLFSFCNPALSPESRASDLVSRLTVDELIGQTSFNSPPIPRLGINAYNWNSKCLHGWSKSDDWFGYTWTVFPAPIGLGATFNAQLLKKIGEITGDEGRALHNLLLVSYDGDSIEGGGLNCIGPVVNVLTNPRMTGVQNTYGEDPLVITRLGIAYTSGLQGTQKYIKVAGASMYTPTSQCHFIGDQSPPHWNSLYLSPLQSVIQNGNISQIFLNGIAINKHFDKCYGNLFKKLIRRKKFGGDKISVCSRTTVPYKMSPALATALLINATIDIDWGDVYLEQLKYFLKDNLMVEKTLRESVWRNFYLRIRLGDFDPPELVPYQYIDSRYLNTPVHQTINLQAALESIVLLKNLAGLLPLDVNSLNKLAVVGPNANATSSLLSSDGGNPAFVISILQGIKDAVNHTHVEVEYQSGCNGVLCPDTLLFEGAVDIVHEADFVIMVMGLEYSIENEGRVVTTCESTSINTLSLPGCQERLIEEIIDYNSHVILILINGGPLVIPDLLIHKGIIGIIEAFYPGALGGKAVSDVLFGRYNPAGRMPYTTLYSEDTPLLSKLNTPDQTYHYSTTEPLIPFGYGLSYTDFEYSSIDISSTQVEPCQSIRLTVSVQNIGDVEGDEVVQVYLRPPEISGKSLIPNVKLIAFERVNIHPQVIHISSFELTPYLLSLGDSDGDYYMFPGQYTLIVTGGLQENKLRTVFDIVGSSNSAVNIKECPGLFADT